MSDSIGMGLINDELNKLMSERQYLSFEIDEINKKINGLQEDLFAIQNKNSSVANLGNIPTHVESPYVDTSSIETSSVESPSMNFSLKSSRPKKVVKSSSQNHFSNAMKKETNSSSVTGKRFYCKICDGTYDTENVHTQKWGNLVPLGKVPFGKGPIGAKSFACKPCVGQFAVNYNGDYGKTVKELVKEFNTPNCPW